jgi:hypothetical protein
LDLNISLLTKSSPIGYTSQENAINQPRYLDKPISQVKIAPSLSSRTLSSIDPPVALSVSAIAPGLDEYFLDKKKNIPLLLIPSPDELDKALPHLHSSLLLPSNSTYRL